VLFKARRAVSVAAWRASIGMRKWLRVTCRVTSARSQALVDALQQRVAVEASARMLSTVDQTVGTLIDVNA
jgi:hypothetical protein